MISKKTFLILFSLLSALYNVGAVEEVVWQERFAKDGELTDLNWKQLSKLGTDDFRIKNGILKALCSFKPYRGSYFSKDIPFINKGYFSFEVNVNTNRGRGYKHLSLKLKFYNLLTSFHGNERSWNRYYDKKWTKIGRVPNSKWVKYKVAFDVKAKTVEYYISDMENPALVDNDIILKSGGNGKGLFGVGNYGLANGTIMNEIKNIRLVKVTEDTKKKQITNNAMIFRGVSFNYYQLDKIVKKLKVTKSQNYNLITGLGLYSKNNLYLDKKPPLKLNILPKYIIMADMPLGESMPLYVQKIIVDSVKNGSTLLILGGMFTLNKGEFINSPIEKILPLKIASPWAVRKLKSPMMLKTTLGGNPSVKYLHQLMLNKGVKVLARADKNPFMVSGKYGKGKVIVCLGMPCGKFPAGETPFWEWNKWPEFITGFTK